MFAKINHVAMCCPNWPMQARFYEAVFGLLAWAAFEYVVSET